MAVELDRPSRKDQTPAVTEHSPTAIYPTASGAAALRMAAALLLLYRDETGQDLVEYALVAACIGLASVAGIHGVAAQIAGDMNLVLNGFKVATGQ